jgi:hypothetical protein
MDVPFHRQPVKTSLITQVACSSSVEWERYDRDLLRFVGDVFSRQDADCFTGMPQNEVSVPPIREESFWLSERFFMTCVNGASRMPSLKGRRTHHNAI